MKNTARRLTVVVMLGALIGAAAAGCSRPPRLAEGPIELSERPTIVRFLQPVTSSSPTWELCFEFDLPGDSHRAAAIHATLIGAAGVRAPLRAPTLDRTGESTVCQIGTVGSAASGAPVVYESVELSSEVALRLRRIRGGHRP